MSTATTELDEVVVHLRPADLTAFQRFHAESQRRQRSIFHILRGQVLWYLFFFGMVLFVLMPESTTGNAKQIVFSGIRWGFCLICGVALGLFLSFLFYYRAGRVSFLSVKKDLDDPRTSWRYGPLYCSISPEGFTNRAEFSTTHERWPAILKIGANDTHAFFYSTETNAHIIPGRAFRDADAFAAFVERARQYHHAYSHSLTPSPTTQAPVAPSDAITDARPDPAEITHEPRGF
jgi:hypothetical protein